MAAVLLAFAKLCRAARIQDARLPSGGGRGGRDGRGGGRGEKCYRGDGDAIWKMGARAFGRGEARAT